MSFKDLGLSPELLKAIEECGYTEPTPIQKQAIPVVLMMRDVVGLAQTGTGKTAGFTLPMIDILAGGRAKARMPRSLILAPTRELAAQVADNFDTYGKHVKLSKALLVGGESMNEQIKILERGVDVLIATPGRLLDLFERGQILLNDIKILVIDEADRMLDMGFIPDIEKIASLLPPLRQTLLFSATMAPEIKKLTAKFLSNPKEVAVAPPASPAETVQQYIVWSQPKEKEKTLARIIDQEDVKSAFIFCNRKKDIAGVESFLQKKGYNVKAMHGDMPQSKRSEVLQDFKDDKVTMLVCSDVAARGIDVQGLSHVFNFDVPMNADDYVHRIGRTGRAGQKGRAWMLATSREQKYVEAIEKRIKKSIEVFSFDGTQKNTEEEKAPKKKGGAPSKKKDSKPDAKKPETKKSDSGPSKNKDASQKPSPKKGGKKQQSSEQGFGNEMPDFFKN